MLGFLHLRRRPNRSRAFAGRRRVAERLGDDGLRAEFAEFVEGSKSRCPDEEQLAETHGQMFLMDV
jgi:hypothetical protein